MTEAPLYLAIDQGGHASRALVFDADGRERVAMTEAIATEHIGADRVEHDADALLGSVRRAVARAVAALGADGARLRAAGLATQRSSIVCWDRRTGAALSKVISWQDRRAAGWLESFSRHGRRVHELTGLVLSPHYGASKLRWCLDTLVSVQRARRSGDLVCGPLASFLLFHLARERPLHADPCNASRTLLWSLESRDWCEELLDLFGVPRGALPECGPNEGAFGSLAIDALRVPLTVCTGDQPAALFAFGRPDASVATVNAGTGAFLQSVTWTEPVRAPGLLTSLAWQSGSSLIHVLEGTVNGAGSALASVARDLGLDPETAPGLLDEWSRSSVAPPLFLNGVSGLGSPFWVSNLESAFVGEGTPQAKLVAVLESVAFLLQVNLEATRACGVHPQALRVTGGLAASEHFCRTLADLSGLPVSRPVASEATARGLAFLLAGQPSAWPSVTAVALEPRRGDSGPRERFARWRGALDAALRDAGVAS